MFDLASLKGLIINDFQAVDLIGILGVKVNKNVVIWQHFYAI